MIRHRHVISGRHHAPWARLNKLRRTERHFRDLDMNAESVAAAIDKRNRELDETPRAFGKITIKMRREAIQICAIAASTDIVPTTIDGLVRAGDFDPDAGDLADAAWCLAAEELTPSVSPTEGEHTVQAIRRRDHGRREPWALAECMLREGWSP